MDAVYETKQKAGANFDPLIDQYIQRSRKTAHERSKAREEEMALNIGSDFQRAPVFSGEGIVMIHVPKLDS